MNHAKAKLTELREVDFVKEKMEHFYRAWKAEKPSCLCKHHDFRQISELCPRQKNWVLYCSYRDEMMKLLKKKKYETVVAKISLGTILDG